MRCGMTASKVSSVWTSLPPMIIGIEMRSALHRLEPGLQLGALGRAGGVGDDGLVVVVGRGEEAVCAHGGDSRVVAVAIVETRYAVPGWGVGEVWRRGDLVLAHDFRFGQASDAVSDTGRDDLIRRFHAFLRGEDVSFADVALDLEWATPLQRAIVDALRAVPRGEVVSYGELAALAGRPRAPQSGRRGLRERTAFAFVVPCHRVVAAHGIGGYGARASTVKRRLLALEGVAL